MVAFWQALTLFERVVFVVTVQATVLFFLQLIWRLFDMGGGGTEPAQTEAKDNGRPAESVFDGLRLVTAWGVSAFFAVAGWVTLWLTGVLGGLPALSAGALAGLLAMYLLALARGARRPRR